ncbi:MAG: hypothetical protein H0T53_07165 [Herpetosiphonaceae bacterium]|nr:hypothetical protein [Herpetosiphonaceae bacterium]
MITNELFQAEQAIAAGDRTTARAILGGLVQRNLADAQVWLLLSQTVDAVEHKRDCLQRALQADPSSVAARQALAALDAPPRFAPAPAMPPAAPPVEAAPAPGVAPPAQVGFANPASAPTPAQPMGYNPVPLPAQPPQTAYGSPAGSAPPKKSRLTTVLVGIGSGLLLGALVIGAIVVLRNQQSANDAAQEVSPPLATATTDLNAPGGVFVTPNPSRPTNTPLPAAEIPPSLLITELVAFEHPATGIFGLRPKNWTLLVGPNAFQVSSESDEAGFFGSVILASQFEKGSAGETTKFIFANLKENGAAGPAPVILEETYSQDGSGVIVVEISDIPSGSSAPIRFVNYAQTKMTPDGLLFGVVTIPSELFPAEEALVRQMVDSLAIK